MSGHVYGDQVRVTSKLPKAKFFVHYRSHWLNLAIVASCSKVLEVRNFMDTFNYITFFFSGSPMGKGILSEKPLEDAGNNLLADSGIGFVNYLTRYSGRLATLSAPLRDLTTKDTAYPWGLEHDRAFTEVKKEVSSLGVLRYFDPHAETVIETDASLKELGTVLLQDGRPVCYASKALTKTEQRYSNIEREALGVTRGLERFHYFIYGKSCTIYTDHKPLETIFREKLSNCPARLQRFVLRPLKYDVTVKYAKGTEVPITDATSQLHLKENSHG